MFCVLGPKVIKTMDRTTRDTHGLTRSNFDGRSINCPGQHTANPLQCLLVCLVFMVGSRQPLPSGYHYFKNGHTAVRIVSRQKKSNLDRSDTDGLLLWIHSDLRWHWTLLLVNQVKTFLSFIYGIYLTTDSSDKAWLNSKSWPPSTKSYREIFPGSKDPTTLK